MENDLRSVSLSCPFEDLFVVQAFIKLFEDALASCNSRFNSFPPSADSFVKAERPISADYIAKNSGFICDPSVLSASDVVDALLHTTYMVEPPCSSQMNAQLSKEDRGAAADSPPAAVPQPDQPHSTLQGKRERKTKSASSGQSGESADELTVLEPSAAMPFLAIPAIREYALAGVRCSLTSNPPVFVSNSPGNEKGSGGNRRGADAEDPPTGFTGSKLFAVPSGGTSRAALRRLGLLSSSRVGAQTATLPHHCVSVDDMKRFICRIYHQIDAFVELSTPERSKGDVDRLHRLLLGSLPRRQQRLCSAVLSPQNDDTLSSFRDSGLPPLHWLASTEAPTVDELIEQLGYETAVDLGTALEETLVKAGKKASDIIHCPPPLLDFQTIHRTRIDAPVLARHVWELTKLAFSSNELEQEGVELSLSRTCILPAVESSLSGPVNGASVSGCVAARVQPTGFLRTVPDFFLELLDLCISRTLSDTQIQQLLIVADGVLQIIALGGRSTTAPFGMEQNSRAESWASHEESVAGTIKAFLISAMNGLVMGLSPEGNPSKITCVRRCAVEEEIIVPGPDPVAVAQWTATRDGIIDGSVTTLPLPNEREQKRPTSGVSPRGDDSKARSSRSPGSGKQSRGNLSKAQQRLLAIHEEAFCNIPKANIKHKIRRIIEVPCKLNLQPVMDLQDCNEFMKFLDRTVLRHLALYELALNANTEINTDGKPVLSSQEMQQENCVIDAEETCEVLLRKLTVFVSGCGRIKHQDSTLSCEERAKERICLSQTETSERAKDVYCADWAAGKEDELLAALLRAGMRRSNISKEDSDAAIQKTIGARTMDGEPPIDFCSSHEGIVFAPDAPPGGVMYTILSIGMSVPPSDHSLPNIGNFLQVENEDKDAFSEEESILAKAF